MTRYAGLGDSFAAGVGAGDATDSCWRSTPGYPVLVAAALGVTLDYQACLGATIADVATHQLDALGDDTAYVSLTVGGNDLGFTHVMTEYALPAWMADDSVLDTALQTLHEQLPGRYADLFAQVRARAPRAQVVVAGYPRLFDGVDCNALTFFSEHEMSRLNDAADQIGEVMDKATRLAGFEFVDVRDAFRGHAVCDDPEWIRGASWPLEASFHPNTAGYAAYGRLVAARWSSRPVPSIETRVQAETAGSQVNPPVSVSCGPCRTTVPPRFAIPDLTTDRSLSGARRHGLDPDEVAHLGMRLKDPAGDRQAVDRVHELDRQVRDHLA